MTIEVSDRFGVRNDPKMPELSDALNPDDVQRAFDHCLSFQELEHGNTRVQAIRVIRYKPGRRCLIEYDLSSAEEVSSEQEAITLIGKIRSRSSGQSAYRLLKLLWDAGFQSSCFDGISVPKPIGIVPNFRMWMQLKMPGTEATHLLTQAGSELLVRQIAEAAHKLHKAGVPTKRSHSMADELRILHEHLPKVAMKYPKWSSRIDRVLDAADRIGMAVPMPEVAGVHRDFYSDQVIVDESRLYLIDFDLYCQGDPGLDIGNFIGHIIEQSIRTFGDPCALQTLEQSMEECFVELSGEKTRIAVQTYATLTLVRHIYLSTLFPERCPFTEVLLEVCEQRLDVKS